MPNLRSVKRFFSSPKRPNDLRDGTHAAFCSVGTGVISGGSGEGKAAGA